MTPARETRAAAALRSPLLHFLLLGTVAFALRPAETPALVFGEVELDRLRADFAAREARAPDAAELDALLEAAIDEEVLLREAWASGRLRHDGTVVARLVALGRFVGAPDGADPEAALRQARALGLDRSDPVIRRYLVERMRLALAAEANHPAPGEAELAAHLARHPERFAVPERLRLVHVFTSARHPRPEARAAAVGRALEGRGPDAIGDLGDPYPHGRRVVATRDELARRFGPEFAAALEPGLRGRWQGPLRSAHGLHWVWLDAPEPARSPALDEVRSAVRQDLLRERRAAHLRRRLDALRAGYEIRVAGRR
jgi:hypothetical protein